MTVLASNLAPVVTESPFPLGDLTEREALECLEVLEEILLKAVAQRGTFKVDQLHAYSDHLNLVFEFALSTA